MKKEAEESLKKTKLDEKRMARDDSSGSELDFDNESVDSSYDPVFEFDDNYGRSSDFSSYKED